MDRSRWRKQIGMSDDHDECEWVNVSSGTSSPGLSQTNSTHTHTHTHNRFTAGLEYVRVHPGQQVPEK